MSNLHGKLQHSRLPHFRNMKQMISQHVQVHTAHIMKNKNEYLRWEIQIKRFKKNYVT